MRRDAYLNFELLVVRWLLSQLLPFFKWFLIFQLCKVLYVFEQVEVSVRANDMFIGTVLRSLEIEDLVSGNSGSRPCYVARSFIGNADAYSSFDVDRTRSFEHDDITAGEGEDKFYEAPENLVDSSNSPQTLSGHLSRQNFLRSENSSLKPPSFTRIAGLLPGDVLQTSKEDIEQTDSLHSFVKAQIVFYDQSSPRYTNIDKQVGVFQFVNIWL